MGCYRRAKFALDTFRNFAAKIKPRNPIQQQSKISHQCQERFSCSSSSSSISQRLGFNMLQKHNHCYRNCFSSTQRRFYYVDRYQVQHFKARGYRKWFQNPRNVFVVVLVSSGVVITIYFGNVETVPYTKRKHLVLLSKSMERRLGEHEFEELKESFKGNILPAIHPESIRVRLIAKSIIDALERGLKTEKVWQDLDYASDHVGTTEKSSPETILGLMEGGKEGDVEGMWHKEDEILDDKWVQQSRKEGQRRGAQSDMQHLEGLNWEIMVVNKPIVNAFCLPGGKIVVFTGLLQHFRTDSEIATIIGHEVGHAVARHSAEGITKNLWFAILQLILFQFVTPDLVSTMSHLLLRLPFSRRMEMEADYIGLLLMASAGCDPRVAPLVYEKLSKVTGGDSALRDYLSTHPSGKRRAELLRQAKVMEEAMAVYREARLGHGVEGFL